MTDKRIASVALQNIIFPIDKLYSYYIPDELREKAAIGSRVLVPFGPGNKKQKGIILDLKEVSEHKVLKPILLVMDSAAVLSDEFVKLAEYIKEHCFCTYYDAVKAMLPSGLNYEVLENYSVSDSEYDNLPPLSEEIYEYIRSNGAVKSDKILELFGDDGLKAAKDMAKKGLVNANSVLLRKTKDAQIKIVSLAISNDEANEYIRRNSAKSPKQTEVLNMLLENGDMSVKELCYMTGVTAAVINTLEKKGIIFCYNEEVFRRPQILEGKEDGESDFVLSEEQEKVYIEIAKHCENGYNVTLLNGVTGSGKTHIYLKLTDDMIEKGKGVIVLVPEISLTSQMLGRFYSRYGDKVALLHSGLSLGERLDEWKRIKSGLASIVIGTRSAAFSPVENLGLMIIDEEQEHTYKSEMSPRFNARDVAKFRCAYHKALLLLASATPSVESYNNAISGRYNLTELARRYNEYPLPNVIAVDMREELRNGNSGILSERLKNGILYNLEHKEQTILFLNRRGYNSFVSCRSCGYVAKCPNCNISLTYHSKNNRLMCHYCGHSVENPKICPECHENNMSYLGVGTQKVEEELSQTFPDAKIIRMDADTTTRKTSHDRIINDFATGQYDILVGTQMVTKGLDFPNVTLAGVIAADLSLYNDDFRANERTFSLITQVTGRAGRGKTNGRAIIQTYTPENRVLNLAFTQDYKAFFKEEISFRKSLLYPPFCDLCMIMFEGESERETSTASVRLTEKLKELLLKEFKNVPIKGLGPNPAVIPKINNKYRYKLLLKCRNDKYFRELINELTAEYYSSKQNRNVYITIDINPEIII